MSELGDSSSYMRQNTDVSDTTHNYMRNATLSKPALSQKPPRDFYFDDSYPKLDAGRSSPPNLSKYKPEDKGSKLTQLRQAFLPVFGFLLLLAIGVFAGFALAAWQKSEHLDSSIEDDEFCVGDSAESVDMVFLLDESSSVGEQNYTLITEGIKNFILETQISNLRVGVVEFSGKSVSDLAVFGLYPQTNLTEFAIQSVIPLTQNKGSGLLNLVDQIENLVYNGQDLPVSDAEARRFTCISCAFQYLLQEYDFSHSSSDEKNVELVVIVVSDGEPTRGLPLNPAEPLRELRDMYGLRVLFMPIGVDDKKGTEVFGSGWQSDDVSFGVEEYNQFGEVVEDLIQEC
eukprot:augustus_masked-scaffold_7-processed-gene-8.13-mRNA-1 protein AED:1.00 eAED:1.00 QI:0/-1/0/0/-1/1/1/0/343